MINHQPNNLQPNNNSTTQVISTIYFDASCRLKNSYGGFTLNSDILKTQINKVYCLGRLTVVDAEIAAALSGLKYAKENNLKNINIYGDCETAIEVINNARQRSYSKYLNKKKNKYPWWKDKLIYGLISSFDSLKAYSIGRDANWEIHNYIEEFMVESQYSNNEQEYWSLEN